MFISSINSVPMAKNYVKANKNKNNSNSNSTTYSSDFMQKHKPAHKPSFGLDPFVTGGIVAIMVAHLIDTYRNQKEYNKQKEKLEQIKAHERLVEILSEALEIPPEEVEKTFQFDEPTSEKSNKSNKPNKK